MRLTSLTVLVGVLLLGAAGCADSPSPGAEEADLAGGSGERSSERKAQPHAGGHSRDPGDETPTGGAVAPAIEPDPVPGQARIQPGDPLPAEQLDTSALPRNYPRKVSVIPGGEVLAVVAKESRCGQAAVEIVEQTSSRVVLLLTEVSPDDAGACTMDIRMPTVTVRLDEPLGSRTVELRLRQS